MVHPNQEDNNTMMKRMMINKNLFTTKVNNHKMIPQQLN
jgi:hypothetical protein